MSLTSYITLLHAAFGALGIVAMSCMTTISGRVEDRLHKKLKDGSTFLEKVKLAGLSTAGVSNELYYDQNERNLLKLLGGVAARWSTLYLAFLGLSFWLIVLRWKGVLTNDWVPLSPALGLTLWLVIETWIAFTLHLASVVQSTSKSP